MSKASYPKLINLNEEYYQKIQKLVDKGMTISEVFRRGIDVCYEERIVKNS